MRTVLICVIYTSEKKRSPEPANHPATSLSLSSRKDMIIIGGSIMKHDDARKLLRVSLVRTKPHPDETTAGLIKPIAYENLT